MGNDGTCVLIKDTITHDTRYKGQLGLVVKRMKRMNGDILCFVQVYDKIDHKFSIIGFTTNEFDDLGYNLSEMLSAYSRTAKEYDFNPGYKQNLFPKIF